MTKISFDVDFNQDPQKILEEIQKRAEAEVAKRESKEKESSYLSKLHEVVNKEIGTDFKNVNALIRALTKIRHSRRARQDSKHLTIWTSQNDFHE